MCKKPGETFQLAASNFQKTTNRESRTTSNPSPSTTRKAFYSKTKRVQDQNQVHTNYIADKVDQTLASYGMNNLGKNNKHEQGACRD